MRDEKRVPVQVGTELGYEGERRTIPERIARQAYAEYVAQGHGSQSFERLHERGGFGIVEAMNLLCERIERLGGGAASNDQETP